MKKISFEPDLNQRPMDLCQGNNYSPPLYQLSYRRGTGRDEADCVFIATITFSLLILGGFIT